MYCAPHTFLKRGREKGGDGGVVNGELSLLEPDVSLGQKYVEEGCYEHVRTVNNIQKDKQGRLFWLPGMMPALCSTLS